MDYYFFALISMFFYFIQALLLKFAAIKKCDNSFTTLYFLATVSLFSIPFLFARKISSITLIGILSAVINGIFYSVQTITRIGALKYVPASIVYPIIRMNNAIVALLLIFLLKESVTLENSVGIVLATISIYLLSKGEKK